MNRLRKAIAWCLYKIGDLANWIDPEGIDYYEINSGPTYIVEGMNEEE